MSLVAFIHISPCQPPLINKLTFLFCVDIFPLETGRLVATLLYQRTLNFQLDVASQRQVLLKGNEHLVDEHLEFPLSASVLGPVLLKKQECTFE